MYLVSLFMAANKRKHLSEQALRSLLDESDDDSSDSDMEDEPCLQGAESCDSESYMSCSSDNLDLNSPSHDIDSDNTSDVSLQQAIPVQSNSVWSTGADIFQNYLTGWHFPEEIPPTSCNSKPQRRCHVCYTNKQRKQTHFMCKECDKALCVSPCFKIYHTKKNH